MDAWEQSKENIQPLINGRQMTSLQAALTPKMDVILHKQNEYERQLRQYEGEDEMEIWHEYIIWAEQNFPQGGKHGNFDTLINQCMKRFINEKKYYNDERFISALLKYITHNGGNIEIFDKMESLGVGFESAKFYYEWAWQLDQLGNTKKSFKILDQAINQGSKPVDILKSLKNNIVYKLADKMNSNDTCNLLASNAFFDEVQDRQVLCGLRPVGYKHRAPANRVSHKIDLPHTVVQQQSKTTVNNKKPAKFQIFSDNETSTSNKLTASNVCVQSLDDLYKENEQKAGKWTHVKLSQREQKIPVVPVGKTMSNHPGFLIHTDESKDSAEIPKKLPETSLVLGVKKQTNTAFDVPNANIKPMYNTVKVYGGAKEMSFEEIRTASWLANQRKIQEAKDEVAKEKELHYKKEIEQLKQQLLVASSGSWSPSSKGSPDSQLSNSSAQYKVKKKDNYSSHHSNNCSDSDNLTVQTGFKKFSPNRSVTRDVINLWNATFVGPECKNSTINDYLKQSQTPESKMILNSQSTQVQLEKHTPFQIYTDFQNCEENKNSAFEINQRKPDFEIYEGDKKPPFCDTMENKNSGFKIYEDENIVASQTCSKTKTPNFEIYQDNQDLGFKIAKPILNGCSIEDSLKENIPPENDENVYPQVQRELAGVLMLSKNIPYQEETSEDSDTSTDLDENDINQPLQPSKTVYFPDCNESERVTKMSSTPYPSMQPHHPTPAFPDDGFTIALDHLKITAEPTEQPQFVQPQAKANKKNSNEPKTNRMSLGVALSPIMERSREISKSSSSSSGYTTSHTTRNSSVFAPKSFSKSLQPKNCTSTECADTNSEAACEIFPSETGKREDLQPKISTDDIFSTAVYQKCLRLGNSIENMPGYSSFNQQLPNVTVGSNLQIGKHDYKIIALQGKGGFGSVYKAKNEDNKIVALKVNRKPNEWEFFISNELCSRLSKLPPAIDIRDSVIHYDNGYFFPNGSILITEFSPFGSLLDMVNINKLNQRSLFVEPLVMYFTWELMQILDYMHRCKIMHVDIKPDNILFINIPGLSCLNFKKVSSLRLIDFGMAIDMTMYKEGITFNQSVKTDGCQCPEMIEQKPWTYQQDFFGLLACIHIMLFSEYMEIFKNKLNIWETKNKIKRYWKQNFWNKLFTTLLNIPSCEKIPSLEPFIQDIELFLTNSAYTSQIKTCNLKWNNALSKK